jgi:hypothetical protein
VKHENTAVQRLRSLADNPYYTILILHNGRDCKEYKQEKLIGCLLLDGRTLSLSALALSKPSTLAPIALPLIFLNVFPMSLKK